MISSLSFSKQLLWVNSVPSGTPNICMLKFVLPASQNVTAVGTRVFNELIKIK